MRDVVVEQWWAIVLIVLGVAFVIPAVSLAPWIPARRRDLHRIVDACVPDSEDATIVEIGSGDGRVTRAIAAAYPDATVIGIELNPLMVCRSRIVTYLSCLSGRSQKSQTKNVRYICANAMRYDFGDVDVVYCFLMPAILNTMIRDEIVPHLSVGSRVVSYVFAIEDWGGGVTTKYTDPSTSSALYVWHKTAGS